jgi:predicted dithiol-disulfide oxidoreductase (DUF899 family)
MGWQFPYVSTNGTDFAFDFGLAIAEQQTQQVPEVKAMIDNPPEEMQEWSKQIGAKSGTACARGPDGSPSRARTAPSTTPTR